MSKFLEFTTDVSSNPDEIQPLALRADKIVFVGDAGTHREILLEGMVGTSVFRVQEGYSVIMDWLD